jgi:divalent metal cation (Fe/Co/Zn/Cd) transporter
VTTLLDSARQDLLRRGLWLEYVTLGWNVVGCSVVLVAAVLARSVALAGFGLDSLLEIFASVVVVWQLTGSATEQRERRALKLIGAAFLALAVYVLAQSIVTLVGQAHPATSPGGIAWLALTLVAMLALAWGKARTGGALNNPVLQTEARVTLVDAYLAAAVLIGLLLNAVLGWWWADPMAGLVIVYYGLREGWHAWSGDA